MTFIPTISVLTSVYKGERYLPLFFENLRAQTFFPELELILVLNAPSAKEKQLAKDFAMRIPEQVNVLVAPKVESLGASWNRAWRAARSRFIAMWNIDDRRTIDSLQRQYMNLEEHPDAVLTYGDYMRVAVYGEEEGERRVTPRYQAGHFRRAFAQGGAFWLLRKDLATELGTFDEQFQVGADMEYSFRIASKGLPMLRTEGLLGYFTDASEGLSTRDRLSAVERTAIQLRYGVFDKVREEYREEAQQYRLDAVKNGKDWLPLSGYLPEHETFLEKQQSLKRLGAMRNATRNLLKRLGILKLAHWLQTKLIRREI